MKCSTLILLLTLTIFFNSSLPAQSCLPNGISFTTQSQVDNFKANYPGCTIIEGNVTINDTNISNLDSLNSITAINGTFRLIDNNPISLTGLQHITSLGGLRIDDDAINYLYGLDNVEIIYGDFDIIDCHGISTEGLTSLEEVQGDVYFNDNTGLTIDGLPALEKIGGSLIIDDNEITSLEGLINVKGIGGELIIRELDSLTSLVGLDSISAQSVSNLILDLSTDLSFCSVKSICDYLIMDLGPSTIGLNSTGCNTETEITNLCLGTTSIEINEKDPIVIFPNPTRDLIQIKSELERIENVLITTISGKQVVNFKWRSSSIDVSSLSAGMYYLEIDTGSRVVQFKFIVIE